MIKEYITPQMDILTILSESAFLTVSDTELEDFYVTDGQW